MSALLDLAKRCEEATGPDRVLDNRIRLALNCGAAFGDDPAYTASLDAAMTLVPEGWRILRLGETIVEGDPPWRARLAQTRFDMRSKTGIGDAVTPALALTTAALRARAAMEGGEA